MPHVVTRSCCNDANCVYACPVNCIHPTPDEPDFATAEMLYIDPAACVDCGACMTACPVGAIRPHLALTPDQAPFLQINADFYKEGRDRGTLLARVPSPLRVREGAPPRVAIVGSGPAAMYAADEMLTIPGATVDMYERLPVPYGLARFGVAPDHGDTRRVADTFDVIARQDGFRLHLNTEVGRDIDHAALLDGHDAVVYAVGAASDRRLDLPGADGIGTATEFVGWYNGHPDHTRHVFDLSHRRAVIIGNGNVALDVARILTLDPATLAATDIAPDALEALRASRVEEVVVLARRGPADSAFTSGELLGLAAAVNVVVEGDLSDPGGLEGAASRKLGLLAGLGAPGEGRRVVLRYFSAPTGLTPDGVLIGEELLEAGLVLSSIGYKGRPVPGLPFDEGTGTVPNDKGRVIGMDRTYVAGWIKRGPNGFIGTNKTCARETVRTLVADLNGVLIGA
ncbi:FAD-dependent oxidoreductase [Actinocorallia sp. A-T 12471]|uniref:FAD-dependent oxidoreductase n=1 Tax=Actinocorallia sp. A-T 12471 TaxID=3089813 RepID=UPI0029D33DF6|nr:FAD-dependent oxidoreductase [Actinocorallia sp. A-T 12471]MDX6739177.1 FAD-dependent oxidoreductase [Actinocorallia sp. A-T 12471]